VVGEVHQRGTQGEQRHIGPTKPRDDAMGEQDHPWQPCSGVGHGLVPDMGLHEARKCKGRSGEHRRSRVGRELEDITIGADRADRIGRPDEQVVRARLPEHGGNCRKRDADRISVAEIEIGVDRMPRIEQIRPPLERDVERSQVVVGDEYLAAREDGEEPRDREPEQ